ncbi:uncharacterized protein PAC_11371 [Phialocephala subalpina]|uniref:Uncharacterized protein n=1 Tax=Phialocephala subalpina TaxID=576137 RepID=A0A1L7X8W1_9HELO|nr:uncharacterized protein PAC_11371 [Phialocephala subalpina]
MDATHHLRRSLQTDDGQPATELLDWNSPSVQRDLRTMAEMFLENNNNCDRFWSPSRTWAQESDLKYPNDRERIIELLVQLFWKQNRYLRNNNQYGIKATGHRDSSREESTPVRDIERQSRVFASSSPRQAHRKRKSDSSAHEKSVGAGCPSGADPQEATTDPFEIFEIPDDADDLQASARASVVARKSKLHRTPRPADDHDARKRKRLSKEKTPRRTGRKRNAVVQEGVFLGQEADKVLDIAEAEEVAESLQLQQSWSRLRQDLDTIPDIEQPDTLPFPENFSDAEFNQTFSSGAHFAVPTAPMTSGDTTTQSEQQLSSERPSLKLRFKVQPSQHFPNEVPQSPTSTSKAQSKTSHTAIRKMDAGVVSSHGQVDGSMMLPLEHATMQTTSTTENPRRVSSKNSSSTTAKTSPASTREDLGYRSPYVSLPMESSEPPHNETSQDLEMSLPTTMLDKQAAAPSMIYKNDKPILNHDFKVPRLPRVPSWSPDAQPRIPSKTVITPCTDENQHPPRKPPVDSHVPAQLNAIAMQDPPQPTVKSQTPSQSPAPVAKPKIQIPLWVILTRDPRYTEKQWNEGNIQGPSLSVFLEGLSKVTRRNNIEKIELTLQTPFSDTILTVGNDDEDAWMTAKATFGKKLKESRAEARMKRVDDTAEYKILIEPFYEQVDLLNGGDEVEEDVFTF